MADDEVILESNEEGGFVYVSKEVIRGRVPVIRDYLNVTEDTADALLFPVVKASKEGLNKVAQWLKKHHGEDLTYIMGVDKEGKTPTPSDWDVEFFNNMPIGMVVEILECSLFLQIQELYRMAVITTAAKIRSKKNVHEIRQMLKITEPLPNSQDEMKWCDD